MQCDKKALLAILFTTGIFLLASDCQARGGGAVRTDAGSYDAGGDHDYPQADQDYQNREDANREDAVGYVDQADFVPYVAAGSTVENVYVQPGDPQPQQQPQVVVAGQPQQVWVAATDGQVPDGAVVNTSNRSGSSQPTYYCQALYGSQTLSGILIPNSGCFVQQVVNGPTIRVTSYNVLVSQTSS
jgi:hypothetical protein